jgi:hypothetical protein
LLPLLQAARVRVAKVKVATRTRVKNIFFILLN